MSRKSLFLRLGHIYIKLFQCNSRQYKILNIKIILVVKHGQIMSRGDE